MSEVTSRRSRRAIAPNKGDVKEQALLATATRLLDEGRFADVSVAEIASEAGLHRASFYFYFGSKQALLAAVVTEAVGVFNARLSAAASDSVGQPPEELVASTLRAAADLWWQHRRAMMAGVELGVTFPEIYEQSMKDVAMVRAPTVDLLRRHGRVPEADDLVEAEHLVTSLILMSERNFYDLARRDAPRTEYDALATRLTRVWQRSFGLGDDRR